MKKINYLIVVILLLGTACGSEQEKKTSDFLANFDELALPYSFDETKKKEETELKPIEKEYIDLLVDTVKRNDDGDSFDFYYIGKIATEKDFSIIIVGEMKHYLDQSKMPYTLFTLSKTGEIISSLPFATGEQDMDGKVYDNLKIDKDLNIESLSYEVTWKENKPVLQLTSNYIIEDNGNIKNLENEDAGSEDMFSDFKEIDLPSEISNVKIGDKIENKGFLKTVTPDYIDKDSEEYYFKNNEYFAIGRLQQTEKYTAVIYRYQHEGVGDGKYPKSHSFFLATYDPNEKEISKKEIGYFSIIEDVTDRSRQLTESVIKINKDFTVSLNETITLNMKYPKDNRVESFVFSIETDGTIIEKGQNAGEEKLKELLSEKDFEYVMQAKKDFEEIKTAKQLADMYYVKKEKLYGILNKKIPNEDEYVDVSKWKFIEEAVPFFRVDEGAEGMGCYANFNDYMLLQKSKQTPSKEDDLFFAFYNELYDIEGEDVKYYGWPSTTAWVTDVEGHSMLGTGKFLKIFKLADKALAKPNSFEKTIKENRKWQLERLVDYSYVSSKQQVLDKLEGMLEEINFSEEEQKKVKEAIKTITAKEDAVFNQKN